MSVRMLPVGTVFNRFPRLTRDLSSRLGKRVRLVMEGEDTELDKGMIERLGDPLTHLVRNAIDHGLETPEVRRAAGKHEEGTVTLRAAHEGGNVIIEIVDDGRGLDATRIREKAVANGLIAPDEVLTPDETHNLIFLPGFSTAAVVSDVSGRGVGMDVVKRNVEAMNGTVTIHSTPGSGSRFRVRLPLTLAILDGLVVRVGTASYVLPLLSVVESLRPLPRDVRSVLGQGEVLVVRGESIPFVRLHASFGHADAVTEPSAGIIVVLETEERRFGVLVDEVVGQQQVVIKNLETNFRKLEAIMGATILGDGRVSLIADVQELYRIATRGRSAKDPSHAALAAAAHSVNAEEFQS
jgi:two-component system chemotaxis sensor kinase CheA